MLTVELSMLSGRLLFLYIFCLCFGIHESDEDTQAVQYEVLLRSTPIEKSKSLSQDFEMVSKYGQKFTCRIPSVENDSLSSYSPLLNNSYVHSLLSPLNRSDCLLFEKDWWTYELCYRKSVVQFHSERDQRQSETTLGYFESETIWNETVEFTNQNATYHRHSYTNGSICDLTAKPRTAEARFTCGRRSSPEIVSVDELESCTYLLIVEVPSLCSHPTFVVSKSPKIEEVLCGTMPDSAAVLSDDVDTAETEDHVEPSSTESNLQEVSSSGRSKRVYRLSKLYSNIRARRHRQLLRHATQVAGQFQQLISPSPLNQNPASTSTLGGFILRLYFQSVVNAHPAISHPSYASSLESYEMQLLERQLGQLFFALMEKLDELLSRVLPILKIPSDSFMYVYVAGDKLATALETKVNESRGQSIHSGHRVEDLLAAMTTFQELCETILKPGLSKLTVRIWRSSMEGPGRNLFKEVSRQGTRCPVESELLRLLIVNFRRLSRISRRIALNLRELERLHEAETELESTFRGLLNRGQFKVLLVRGTVEKEKPQDSQAARDVGSIGGTKSRNPVVHLLKKVLRKVAPDIAGSLEVYEAPNMIDGYSSFYVTADEAKSKEERRMAKLEKAYQFRRKERSTE